MAVTAAAAPCWQCALLLSIRAVTGTMIPILQFPCRTGGTAGLVELGGLQEHMSGCQKQSLPFGVTLDRQSLGVSTHVVCVFRLVGGKGGDTELSDPCTLSRVMLALWDVSATAVLRGLPSSERGSRPCPGPQEPQLPAHQRPAVPSSGGLEPWALLPRSVKKRRGPRDL